jgi:hypothetical protein
MQAGAKVESSLSSEEWGDILGDHADGMRISMPTQCSAPPTIGATIAAAMGNTGAEGKVVSLNKGS